MKDDTTEDHTTGGFEFSDPPELEPTKLMGSARCWNDCWGRWGHTIALLDRGSVLSNVGSYDLDQGKDVLEDE